MHYLLYNEKKRHGTPDFPVAYYYVNEQHPRYSMPFHWHQEWEIIHILSGRFSLNINGREFDSTAGDVFLLPAGMLHGGVPQGCVYECLNFDLEELCGRTQPTRRLLGPFFRGRYIPLTRLTGTTAAAVAAELLAAAGAAETDANILNTVAHIQRLFADLLATGCYSEVEPSKERGRAIDRLKPVLEYVELHFGQPLSLETLAAVIEMNPKYFCRFFRQATGQPPMNYVSGYRVEQAAHMLRTTDLTVTEIGLECGFCDTSHFVKTFRKIKGVTPKQYHNAAV